jgi:putative hydrolase of the HAD superfamily
MTTHYKAVFFDLDGTLRIPSPSPTEAFIQFARSQQIHIDEGSARRVKIWAHRYWGQDAFLIDEMARLGEDKFWVNYSRKLLETARVTEQLHERAQQVKDWFGAEYVPTIHLATGAVQLLTHLKDAGYILGVISNRSRPFHDVLERLGIADCFDFTLAAGEIGIWKPNTAIFDHARSHFTMLAATDCLYIGDNYFADGIGASRAGMTPVIFDPDGLYGEMAYACIRELGEITAVLQNSHANRNGN